MLALGLFLKSQCFNGCASVDRTLAPTPPPPGGHELLASPRMPWDYLGCRNPLSSKGQHIARIASLCGIPSAMATGAGPHVGT